MLDLICHVRKITYPSGQTQRLNHYKCDCGTIVARLETNVKNPVGAHCGCKFNYTTNWKYGKQLKKRWRGINSRTINGNMPSKHILVGPYANVTICDEWKKSFKSFYDWSILNGFEPHLHIDRKDSKRGYEPLNCRWVTQQDNNRNGARSKLDIIRVREILLLHGVYSNLDIARVYEIDPSTLVNICKGVIWKDVFKKYGTEKNSKRLSPKFLLPIVKELKPGNINFNDTTSIRMILEGYLSLSENTKYRIFDLKNEYYLYSRLDTSINNHRNFYTILTTFIKDDRNINKCLNRTFIHNKNISKKDVKDFFNTIITTDIKNNFVTRLFVGNKILLKYV